MKEAALQLLLYKYKEHERLPKITILETGQPRRNGYIPENTQPTKTES